MLVCSTVSLVELLEDRRNKLMLEKKNTETKLLHLLPQCNQLLLLLQLNLNQLEQQKIKQIQLNSKKQEINLLEKKLGKKLRMKRLKQLERIPRVRKTVDKLRIRLELLKLLNQRNVKKDTLLLMENV